MTFHYDVSNDFFQLWLDSGMLYWVRRLEAAHEAALTFVNESTYRTWRLHMAGSAHGFECGRLAVYQTLLATPDKRGRENLPLTRRDWYETR